MTEKIKIAKTAGFCMGVRRAVDIALEQANLNTENGPIYTFGPLIHNPQVLNLLKDKNINCITKIPQKGTGTIIIRAHGIPPQQKAQLKETGFKTLDATCPRVIKVQAIIKKHAAKGYKVIIVGDHDHAEVIGLAGYAGKEGVVVNSMEEFEALPKFENAIVVAQTTQNTKFYQEIHNKVEKNYSHYKFFNTICDSTEKRQQEIKKIAKEVDAVIVVGGKTSGNTKRLKEVASQQGTEAFHIENEKELDINYIASKKKIGITAGASTPNWVISQVYKAIKTAKLKKDQSMFLYLFLIVKFLLRSNILLALGAGALTMATSILIDADLVSADVIFTSFLYIFSIHTINNLTLINSDKFNDPQKAGIYEKYKYFIFVIALMAGLACLYTSFSLGFMPFFIIFLMSGAGLCYKLPVINIPGITNGFEPLNKIPGIKAILIAGAWGIICSLIPIFAANGFSFGKIPGIFTVFIFSASMAFFRTAWCDLLAIQGNKIAGEITIPILIGEEKTSKILKYLLAANILILFAGSYMDIISNFGYLLILYPASALFFILKNEQNEIRPGFFDDIITESMFLIAGVLSVIWYIFI